MINKRLYVAIPYSSDDKNIEIERYEKVTKLTAKLTKLRYKVMSPITYGHTLIQYEDMPGSYDFWEDFCISFLKDCDLLIVLTLDGWEDSKGLNGEIEYATHNHIPIIHVSEHKINGLINYLEQDPDIVLKPLFTRI